MPLREEQGIMPDALPSNNISGTQDVSEHATTIYPWLRSYQQGVPAHLKIPDEPLTWLLNRAANQYPNHTAILYYGTKITYAQLSNLANRFANSLQRLGIQKGDRIALALPNIPQFPIAFYGALRAGAIVVPTNPLYTEHEMHHQLVDAGAKFLVMLESFYPVVRKVKQATMLEQVIVTSPADFLPRSLRMLYPLSHRQKDKDPQLALGKKEIDEDPTLHQMHPMLKSHSQGGIELFNLPTQAKSHDLAVLQYTGGTTGVSKGAMLTHRNLLANTYQTYAWMPDMEQGTESTLCVAPFFHCYGLTVGMNLSILNASSMILLPRFNAREVLKVIQHYRPTLLPGIPTMYIAILREAGKHTEQLQSIKLCISGASPLPAQVQTDFNKATHGTLVEGYGLTEAAPVTHANPLTDQCRNGSIGLPLPDVEATILNPETGTLLPAGENGEIVVKGPNIMRGYWNREDETRNMFINGWMRTGDIGYMDEDGYFYIVDRSKDMILASGFNVFPREVEEVLYEHPAVMEAGVVGVPDTYRGETVAAFIVLNKDYEASDKLKEEIVAFCKERLAGYKVPKQLEFRASLPKSIIGKILRRELRTAS
jgi:long-chain acyl-CoA synthetase